MVPADDGGWHRFREGCPDAFAGLFRRHGQSIYNYCFRRTADWALAEDLTSVVFLEAWRHREELPAHRDSLVPWLYGVASNVLRNHRRSSRRREALLKRLSPEDLPDFSDDLVDRLDATRQMQEILEVIERLPLRQQDVLSLCLWEGLSYEETAFALGLPVGTVRSRLARAKASIRRSAVADSPTDGSKASMTQQAEVDHG